VQQADIFYIIKNSENCDIFHYYICNWFYCVLHLVLLPEDGSRLPKRAVQTTDCITIGFITNFDLNPGNIQVMFVY
jgi:hypothetical protein